MDNIKIPVPEPKKIKIKPTLTEKLLDYFFQILFGVSGIVLVFVISTQGKVNQPLIIATLSLCVALIFPKYGFIFLASALGGVLTPQALENIGFIFLSGVFLVIIYNLTEKLFADIGGKAGTLSFFGNMFAFLFVYLIGLSKVYDFDYMSVLWDPAYYTYLDNYIYAFGPICSLMSCVGGHLISVQLQRNHQMKIRIVSYSCINIMGFLILLILNVPFRIVDGTNTITYGAFFINFWHIGALASLSAHHKFKRLFNKYAFYHYMAVGYIAGWIGVGQMGFMVLGGKHGFCAFQGNLVYIYFIDLLNKCFPSVIRHHPKIAVKIISATETHATEKEDHEMKKLEFKHIRHTSHPDNVNKLNTTV
jgi:hypothetical protein